MSVILTQEMLNEIRSRSNIFKWFFENDNDRLNSTAVSKEDEGKLGLQTDNYSVWILRDYLSKTWLPLTNNSNVKRVTENYEAVVDDYIFIDAPDNACKIYIVLPKNIKNGDRVTIIDGRCNFGKYNNIEIYVRSASHDVYGFAKSSIRLNTSGVIVDFIYNSLLERWILNPNLDLYVDSSIQSEDTTELDLKYIVDKCFKYKYYELYKPMLINVNSNYVANDKETVLVKNDSSKVKITLNGERTAHINVKNLSNVQDVIVYNPNGTIDGADNTVTLPIRDCSFSFIFDENGRNCYII